MAADESEALLALAELSGFRRMGRTGEVELLSRRSAERRPDAVRSFELLRLWHGNVLTLNQLL